MSIYRLCNDLWNHAEVGVSNHSLLQTRQHSVGGVQQLHLTSFKCSTQRIFMNMHVMYTRIGKQAHSVNIQLRQVEDRKCLII